MPGPHKNQKGKKTVSDPTKIKKQKKIPADLTPDEAAKDLDVKEADDIAGGGGWINGGGWVNRAGGWINGGTGSGWINRR
jgi:hypothetical protein